jgi:hypothetical protein
METRPRHIALFWLLGTYELPVPRSQDVILIPRFSSLQQPQGDYILSDVL